MGLCQTYLALPGLVLMEVRVGTVPPLSHHSSFSFSFSSSPLGQAAEAVEVELQAGLESGPSLEVSSIEEFTL